MKCTMQWGPKCENEAVYELRQYKDIKNPNPDETYNIGFNCDLHVPKNTAQNFIITDIETAEIK